MSIRNYSNRLLLLMAVGGLVLTGWAMSRWVPDVLIRLPTREQVALHSVDDAEQLGYRVEGEPKIQVSAGPRFFMPLKPLTSLIANEADAAVRRDRMMVAPLVRLAARFRTAVGPNGSIADLVLEYDVDGCLVGSSFGIDGLVVSGLPPPGGVYFADDLAEKLLRGSPPMRRETGLGGLKELLYEGGPGGASAYVFLDDLGGWIGQRQPAPDLLASNREIRFWSLPPARQVELYVAAGVAFLLLGVLLWRLSRRRAGFAQSAVPALLLAIGLLPVLGSIDVEPSVLVALAFLFLLPQLGVLLVWIVGEAELREARPGSAEHWDRLVRRVPLKSTGTNILAGLGYGCVLSGLIAASGQIAQSWGGGYGAFLITIPDYWTLSSSLSRGLAIAALTAFLVGMGGRVGGRPGAMVGAGLAGLAWSLVVPVAPIHLAWGFGAMASFAAGWVAWHRGFLALVVACLTGLSIPAAWVAWSLWPQLAPTALVSSLPVLLLPLGLILRQKASAVRTLAPVEPAYVANLEHEARLEAEVALLSNLQLSLLPDPDADRTHLGIDAVWKMVPAETVGGDFLDLVEDEEGRVWIAVADAAGHGISCSVSTAFTKAAIAEHAVAGVTPKQAIEGIRRMFSRLRGRRSMVTLLLAVWDPSTRQLRVAAAGHPPLLLLDGDGLRELGAPARPLGIDLPGEDVEEVAQCPEGTLVVALTDGVGEAVSPANELFGYERWASMLPELRSLPTQEVLHVLLTAVDRHRSGRPATDDTTAMVVRFL